MTESFSQCRPAGRRDNRQESTGARSTGGAGFALPGILLALVLLGAIAVASMMTTGQDHMTGRALRESAKAFYAAEAGANAIIAEWDQSGYDALLAAPGDSLDLGWRTLENNLSYWAMLRRVDGGSVPRFYTVSITGRGLGVLGGQRVVGVVMHSTATTLSVAGAVVAWGQLEVSDVSGAPVIDGNDSIPPGWSCDLPGAALPGVNAQDTTLLSITPGAILMGDPPIQQDTTIDPSTFTQFGDLTYADLVAIADKTYPPGPGPSSFGPGLDVNGNCDTSIQSNWGDPLVPGSPCSTYFPIIHFQGNVQFTTVGSAGQGIMLVDGDLSVGGGDFTFYGLIVVQGRCFFEYNSLVYGAILCANPLNQHQEIGGYAQLRYSSCALQRVSATTQAIGPVRPLAQGGWWQTMN